MATNPKPRPPESEARAVITAMVVITTILIVFIAATDMLGLTAKSIVMTVWIFVMMAILRRYRLGD